MYLGETLGHQATDAAASEEGIAARCEASNFRCEPAVTDERAQEYSGYVGAVASHRSWKAEHRGYLSSFVHVAKDLPRSAQSFMALTSSSP